MCWQLLVTFNWYLSFSNVITGNSAPLYASCWWGLVHMGCGSRTPLISKDVVLCWSWTKEPSAGPLRSEDIWEQMEKPWPSLSRSHGLVYSGPLAYGGSLSISQEHPLWVEPEISECTIWGRWLTLFLKFCACVTTSWKDMRRRRVFCTVNFC